jgi:uncharacterized repeat protein (TIGR03943 family)
VNRQAQAAVLFLVGAAVLHAGITDLYLRYVKAGLRPLLLLAGVVLIAAAITTVWYERRLPRTTHGHRPDPDHSQPQDRHGQHGHQDQHGQQGQQDHQDQAGDQGQQDQQNHQPQQDHQDQHGHAHREPRISWLLVLPLLALILVAPPALGSYSAMRTGTALQRPFGFPALPAAETLQLSAIDYADRAVFDHGRSLSHRRIKITGFIALDRSGKPYLTRMVLNCCAADALPVKIGLTGQTPPILQPDTWFEVTGSYTGKKTKDPMGDGVIPFIEVEQVRSVPAPSDQYESPS